MKNKVFNMRMDENQLMFLKELSSRTGRPVSEIIRASIEYVIKTATDEKGYIREDIERIERIEISKKSRFYPGYNTNFETRR